MPVAIDIVRPGPLPLQPLHAITALPGVIIDDALDRWIGGVALDNYPCSGVLGWDSCSEGSDGDVKEDGDYPAPATYSSFTAYAPITCSSFGQFDGERLRERATRYLDAADHVALEAQVWNGSWVPSNPNFAGDATDVGGGAVDILRALGLLEEVGSVGGLQGVVHMSPRTATIASGWGLVYQDNARTLRTVARGTPVSVGDGYDARFGPSGVGANQEWIMRSGPLEIRRSEVFINEDIAQSLDHSTNTYVIRAERYVNVAYDPCGLSAALVDLTKTGAQ
jgi:hypothetical protein